MKCRSACLFSFVGIAALAFGSLPGCGSEQATSGTQVQVTDDMKREAEASANYLENQAKNRKSAPRKNPDAVEPGRP
jgi:hypothetical protein